MESAYLDTTIQDANSINTDDVLDTDVCIAGAGAAGITIAREFASDSTNVILLEGGPLNTSNINKGSDVYDGTTTGLPIDISHQASRVRAFGGTTNHWGGWCRPLDEDDLSAGGYPPNAEWPPDYEELVPYYNQAQTICDLGGFEYDAENISAQEDKSLIKLDDSHIKNVAYQRSYPARFNRMYYSEIEESDNVTMYYHANLVEIVPAQDQTRIERYRCKKFDNTAFEVEASQFVLALGGLENPRLLLSSTSQSPSGVGNDNYLVGRYFMQHPHFDTEAYLILEEFDQSFYQWHNAEIYSDVENKSIETEVQGALTLDYTVGSNNDLPNIACTVSKSDDTIDSAVASESVANLPQFLPDEITLYRLYIRGEQKPLRDSRVTLLEQTDTLGIPRIEVDWRIAESDLRKHTEFSKEIGREFSKASLGRIWTRTAGDDTLKYQNIWGAGHHMGTTRMSEDPNQGVVNSECKVHGVDNLSIAGSSVFPTGGYANLTLTIVALAHRLSEHLEDRLDG